MFLVMFHRRTRFRESVRAFLWSIFVTQYARACVRIMGFYFAISGIQIMAGRKNRGMLRMIAANWAASEEQSFQAIDKIVEEMMAFRLPGEEARGVFRHPERQGYRKGLALPPG